VRRQYFLIVAVASAFSVGMPAIAVEQTASAIEKDERLPKDYLPINQNSISLASTSNCLDCSRVGEERDSRILVQVPKSLNTEIAEIKIIPENNQNLESPKLGSQINNPKPPISNLKLIDIQVNITSSVNQVVDKVAQVNLEPVTLPSATTNTPVVGDRIAPTIINQNSTENLEISSPDNNMLQVTSVSQLSDVQPTDWAFQALQSLVERYGALAGYPDGTFRGDRALSRYEFAAGLNVVLEKISQLIGSGAADTVREEDLETLQRLRTDFATELANLGSRVDNLEGRISQLEARQFSTTVTLGGQAIFGLAAGSGGKPPGKGEANAVLNYLTQLQLASSFTGKDVLRLGLVAGNFSDRGFANPNAFNTNMALLSYQSDLKNDLELNSLEYRFAGLGDRVVFTVKPVGFSLSSVLTNNSPYDSPGEGAVSRFAGSTPVFKIGNLDAGVGFDWLVSNRVRLQFAYGSRDANISTEGLFSGGHRALGAQLLLKPTDRLITGLSYVNAFSSDGRLDTFTGSNNADVSGGFNEPATIHALGGTLQWRLADNLTFGTWGGLILTDSLKSDALALSSTYLFSLGLSNPFGRQGDLLAFLFGQPPKLLGGVLIERVDEGTSLHYEAFYRFRLNDNISITPGFFMVTDPGHISENNNIFLGTIRTTFSF
jgi:hypothetical protein